MTSAATAAESPCCLRYLRCMRITSDQTPRRDAMGAGSDERLFVDPDDILACQVSRIVVEETADGQRRIRQTRNRIARDADRAESRRQIARTRQDVQRLDPSRRRAARIEAGFRR